MREFPNQRRVRRRDFLRGSVAAAALGAGALAGCAPTSAPTAGLSGPPAPLVDEAGRAVPFHGAHQPGILDPAPAAAILAALDTTATDRAALAAMFRTITERVRLLMAGFAPPERNPLLPPADSGILGLQVPPGNLTVTMAVGASLFDARFGLASHRPRDLVAMPRFPNDALNPRLCHGDLLLQLCADRLETCLHALRDLMAHTRDTLVLRWMRECFTHPERSRQPGRATARNLLGFKDGTANPDPTDAALMDQLVWVQPGSGEPAWSAGGTYQVVRIIRMFVERWDRASLREQERIIGRHKATGAPLGAAREEDPPDYDADPDGRVIPLDAHIRLANPRTPEAMARRILRRSFSYSRGFDEAGQLDQGLVFICFQRSIEHGFASIQARLNGEPLEEYIRPIGGGYFFVLPGAPDSGRFLGDALLP